jgi:hypothetical protein
MLTYHFIKNILLDSIFENGPFDYFVCLFGIIFTIPLDIILSPLEILGALLYFVNTKIQDIKEER